MEKIWAPWRNKYVTLKTKKKCIFCIDKKSASGDKKKYILKRNKYCFSLLNLYPYNNGHVMVAPYRHVGTLEMLKERELLDLIGLVNHTKKKMDKSIGSMGYNIGVNIGKAAGAGFPDHVHMHIVPRWEGDTNFMPVLSDTKVIAASLDDMFDLLKG